MDFPRSLTWGGGALLSLVGVGLAGAIWLPGWARLGLVVLAILGTRAAWYRVPSGPERDVALPVVLGVVVWLGLVWGLGLLSPAPVVGLVALGVLAGGMWWHYGVLIDQEEGVEAVPDAATPLPAPAGAPDPTPDERLDALLREAPIEGIEFGDIATAMEPWMARSTVAARLHDRALKVRRGWWRSRPTGVPQEDT